MKTFETITDARNGLMDYRADHLGKDPEKLQTRFKELMASPSPVDQIVGVAELLYANRDVIPDAGRELAGGLAAFAATNAWHGLTDRGPAMVQALRRDLGEKPVPGLKFPKPEDDPAPASGYKLEADQPTQPAAE